VLMRRRDVGESGDGALEGQLVAHRRPPVSSVTWGPPPSWRESAVTGALHGSPYRLSPKGFSVQRGFRRPEVPRCVLLPLHAVVVMDEQVSGWAISQVRLPARPTGTVAILSRSDTG